MRDTHSAQGAGTEPEGGSEARGEAGQRTGLHTVRTCCFFP